MYKLNTQTPGHTPCKGSEFEAAISTVELQANELDYLRNLYWANEIVRLEDVDTEWTGYKDAEAKIQRLESWLIVQTRKALGLKEFGGDSLWDAISSDVSWVVERA